MAEDMPKILDTRGMISFRLARTHARMSAQSALMLRNRGGLSVMKWRVLFMVDALGRTTPAEIVRQTGLDKGQLSRTVRDMVAEGLLLSEPSPYDLRAQVIEISDRGRELFLRARPALFKRQDRFLNLMTPDELETFLSVLDRLEREMDLLDAEEETFEG